MSAKWDLNGNPRINDSDFLYELRRRAALAVDFGIEPDSVTAAYVIPRYAGTAYSGLGVEYMDYDGDILSAEIMVDTSNLLAVLGDVDW